MKKLDSKLACSISLRVRQGLRLEYLSLKTLPLPYRLLNESQHIKKLINEDKLYMCNTYHSNTHAHLFSVYVYFLVSASK